MTAIRIVALDHVVLRVADIARSRAWYETALGCAVERVAPSIGLVQLRAGSSLIDLVPAGGAGADAAGANMDHFCVQLAEFDEAAIVAHLAAKGVAHGAVARRYGARGHGPSLYLTDPDGNTVELKGPPDPDQSESIPNAIRP